MWDVPLTGEREADGAGGWNWRVVSGVRCASCSESLVWLHQPPPEALVFPKEWLARSEKALGYAPDEG